MLKDSSSVGPAPERLWLAGALRGRRVEVLLKGGADIAGNNAVVAAQERFMEVCCVDEDPNTPGAVAVPSAASSAASFDVWAPFWETRAL